MDASFVALVISGVAVALALLALVRDYERHKLLALRVCEHEGRLDVQRDNKVEHQQFDSLNALVNAHIRKDEAGFKMASLALADRIDALAARMDAVELACGVREKPKTMGGHGE
jgi:hypothetical protein